MYACISHVKLDKSLILPHLAFELVKGDGLAVDVLGAQLVEQPSHRDGEGLGQRALGGWGEHCGADGVLGARQGREA